MPDQVVAELMVDAAFDIFWEVDMARPFLPLVGATDASLEYGHGAAVAPLRQDRVAQLARLAVKAGAHVLLDGPSCA